MKPAADLRSGSIALLERHGLAPSSQIGKGSIDLWEALMTDDRRDTLLTLTAEIVASHVANNQISVGDVPALISKVHASLAGLGEPAVEPAIELSPAVSVRASVKPDYIICLEDGKKTRMLKRHLRTAHGLTPDEYRAKWGLAKDYPMVAPAYAEVRRALAVKIGLGKKRGPRSAARKASAGRPQKK